MKKENKTVGRGSYASRRRSAWRKAASAKVDALLVTQPEDVGYLTGFSGEDSFLLLGDGWTCLLTDGRYVQQAKEQCSGIEIHIRSGRMIDAIAACLKGRGIRRLAIQSDHMTVRWQELLTRTLSTRKITPVDGLVTALRVVKDVAEIKAIRKAIRIAERAFRELTSGGAKTIIGRSEREVAAELDYRMRLAGADKIAFETIVAVGSHSSIPHHRPGGRRIRRYEPVLIDWGAMVNGYHSDLTRVVFVGRIPPKLAGIYEVVRRAQSAAISAIRSGVSCQTPNVSARRVIEEAGHGRRIAHAVGHGIGREVHEEPALADGVKRRLRSGMVVTVEPGIYIPSVGGVRIEDDIEVTPDGCRRLSSLPRALAAMVLR